MRTVTPKDRMRFEQYVKDAGRSSENLAFLLNNLGENITVDCSIESIEKIEAVFWRGLARGLPKDLTDADHLAQLIGQYVGECIIRRTGGRWAQCEDPNAMFGQPCIAGFGGGDWDRIYPVEIALHLKNLARESPNFPGVRDRRVFAKQYERAIRVFEKSRSERA